MSLLEYYQFKLTARQKEHLNSVTLLLLLTLSPTTVTSNNYTPFPPTENTSTNTHIKTPTNIPLVLSNVSL